MYGSGRAIMSIQVPAEKGVASTPFFLPFFPVFPHSPILTVRLLRQTHLIRP
jgi:hypothetical protein